MTLGTCAHRPQNAHSDFQSSEEARGEYSKKNLIEHVHSELMKLCSELLLLN